MANMTAAADEQMNSRLKKDYDAKKNNLTSYYKQLYGKSNDAASVGSGSSASTNSYSSYLSDANEKLKKTAEQNARNSKFSTEGEQRKNGVDECGTTERRRYFGQ